MNDFNINDKTTVRLYEYAESQLGHHRSCLGVRHEDGTYTTSFWELCRAVGSGLEHGYFIRPFKEKIRIKTYGGSSFEIDISQRVKVMLRDEGNDALFDNRHRSPFNRHSTTIAENLGYRQSKHTGVVTGVYELVCELADVMRIFGSADETFYDWARARGPFINNTITIVL